MTTKYHVSPRTGKKQVCNATVRACRYGAAAHTIEADKTESVNEFFNIAGTTPKKTPAAKPAANRVPEKTQKFVELLNAKFGKQYEDSPAYMKVAFSIEPGRVYDKIVIATGARDSRSVYAFATKNEDRLEIIKSANWKAPQKNADGSLAIRHSAEDEAGVKAIVEQADQFGSFLYAR